MLFRCLSVTLIFVMAFGPALSQDKRPVESSLRVTVIDQAGAAIANARVTISKQSRTLVTGQLGEAFFSGLAPGKYQLQVEAAGFTPVTVKDVNLRAAANSIEVKLDVAGVQEEITVERDKREAGADPRSANSMVLTEEQIAQLPDDPEEFEQAIRNIAGPGATFKVNGFRGGKFPPKNQIREIRFRTNAYAAENHESSFMSVDIFTKPGIESWHGGFNIGFRDESLNARNAFAPARAAEQNRRFGFEFGGPLWKKRTSLFLSADGVNSYEAKTIYALRPGGILNDTIRQPWRTLNLNARVEHLLTPTHTSRVEYQRNATRRDNNGVGSFDLPERAYTTDSAEHVLRFADSGSIGKKLFNEIRFQTIWQGLDIDSLSDATTIQVLGAFSGGGAQIASSRRSREIELADNMDMPFKKHGMRAGFQIEASAYNSTDLRNQNGAFIFSSLADFQAGRPTTFRRRSGAGSVDFDQVQFGWFAQDDWRILKSLTLSFGARHEMQNHLDDRNNFMPRAGFAWSPFKKGNTTIRGGGGIFHDWFGAEIYEQALRVNGQRQSDLDIRNPGFPDPFSGGTAVTLPASRIRVDPDLRMPYVAQASVGVEQSLPHNIRLMSQYSYRRGIHQLRGRNINAPVGGILPDPDSGVVTQVESSADSFSHLWFVNFNWSKMGKFMIGAGYGLSKTTDETDGALSLPADNFYLRGERGPSLQDTRHRFNILTNFRPTKSLSVSAIFNANSGRPYNITTGFDDNKDLSVNDRPAGVGRNSARGAGQWDLSSRLSWSFSFGRKPDNGAAGGPQVRIIRAGRDSGEMLGAIGSAPPGPDDKRFRTQFFIQATNVLNHANHTGFSGVLTSPFFGQPTAAMPGRRIETGMRFAF
ncbi:MAG TPA: carboxypeptidase regulatory-like domain-containing protein [Blastocatellia bacterium]|nr:carboxypeptidase regulatory-like domain-containing protein [Blastocatellia bacterium]